MNEALDNLKMKGVEITDEECEGALLAILMHDIGHGPYSHALENKIILGGSHEDISRIYLEYFNDRLKGKLNTALEIFNGTYHRKFLCQLVSGQLDVDRLDYLRRDSFYTGVSEGVIGSDRIIKMMNVINDELVIDEKGIYSVEKFLIARNLMYWQVYLHKTVICAEMTLVKVIERAIELKRFEKTAAFSKQFNKVLDEINIKDLKTEEGLKLFSSLDDHDIMSSCKLWIEHKDPILSSLSQMLVNRNLLKVELRNGPLDENYIDHIRQRAKRQFNYSNDELAYFVLSGEVSNTTYQNEKSAIKINFKNGDLLDFAEASRQYDLNVLTKEVQKHYICYPKSLSLS